MTCDEAKVHIVLREQGRTDLICTATDEAIRFMASIGIHQQAAITINVTKVFPGGHEAAFGTYDWRDRSVYVRSSNECLNNGSGLNPFGIKCNEAIYKGFVAHETAHAVSALNFDCDKPSVATQEYIAAVVEFSVMEAKQRQDILSAYKIDGFESPEEINLLAYELDPIWFAVKAYRHFIADGNGQDFVARLISCDIQLSDYAP